LTTIDGYAVDACTVTPTRDSELAGDVLESGARYTDHVHRSPPELRLECVVSDYPLGALVAVRAAERSGGDPASYSPCAFARQRLESLVGGSPVDVVTPLATYEGYVLRSLSYDEHPHALRFSASLVKLTTVTLARELVTIATAPTAAGQKNLGFATSARALGRALEAGARDVLEDLAGNPVQIYDNQGRMAAWRNSRTGEWIDRKGRVVDPFDPQEIQRLKDPDGVGYDPASKQLLTREGLPLSRTSAGKARARSIQQLRSNNTASGALTRALTPGWDRPYGAI
jgi:hypothetical protein